MEKGEDTMKSRMKGVGVMCLGALLLCGCGHTQVSKIGLISFGDLEGKTIPAQPAGRVVEGSAGGYVYHLSDAARAALKETDCDTLVDVEVTARTGLLVPSNKIIVKGTALNSAELK
jgi:hypothetical protein